MKLDLEQMKTITFGALRVVCNEAGEYVFYRFTEHQMEDVYIEVSDFYKKSSATASVQLDFYTDSSSLSFHYTLRFGTGRKFAYFDTFVDGVLVSHEGVEDMSSSRAGDVQVTLGDGKTMHRVTVYLPNLSIARLSDVTLDDGASIRRAERSRKILAMGDSITQGYDAIYPSQSYANKLGEAFDAEVLNQAIGGEIFRPAVLDEDLPFDPDFITVAYGTNDWSGQTLEVLMTNPPAFLDKLAAIYPDKKIFVILPIWRADAGKTVKSGKTFEEMREFYRACAEKHPNMIVVDGMKLTPHLPAFYSDLYLHPTDYGFQFYAENLIRELKKAGI